jgi:5S rRNA maturation endonuclease (ribonuclease M5)|tara:strand:- start:12146 stop:13204 length:1059 start_codon:yes stop_codon:yes gene_type:complete
MCGKAVRQSTTLDLNKVRDIIFQDIYKLLDSFDLEYTQDADNIFMKCPIHEGSDNPQGLSISLDKQVWRCWTRGCHDHYSCNIWGFIKGCLQTDSFSDALKYVCKLYDVNGASKNDNGINTNNPKRDNDFSELVRQIKGSRGADRSPCEVEHLSRPKTESCPSPYFIARGYEPETLRFFGVQQTPNDTRGVLRHRAIIPIWGVDGKYVGYIGRATRDFIQPKYIFSKGIRKSDYLYNYHNATTSMVHLNTLFLVEGQGDVWRLWECGVKNAVGLFGKDISSQQRKLLLNSGATRLVVLTDNDQAGRESKIKIKRELGRLFKLVFPKMHTKDLGGMLHETIEQNILKDLRGYY